MSRQHCLMLVLYKTRMSRKPIYVWKFGFILNLHAQKTCLFLEVWVYTKFACPETDLFFGILGLYKLCMSRNFFIWGVYQIGMSRTNLFSDLLVYNKSACPETIFGGNFGFIPNLHAPKRN